MSEKNPLIPEISPLTEAEPNSLNEFISTRLDDVFNRKPSEISDEDIRTMVEYYRRERLRFQTEQQIKATQEPKKRTRKTAGTPKSVEEAISSYNVDDLL